MLPREGCQGVSQRTQSTSIPPRLAHRSCWVGQLLLLCSVYYDLQRPGVPTPPPPGTRAQTRLAWERQERVCGIQTNRPPLCFPQLPFIEDKPGLHFRVSISAARGWCTVVSVETRTENFLPNGSAGYGPDGRAAGAKQGSGKPRGRGRQHWEGGSQARLHRGTKPSLLQASCWGAVLWQDTAAGCGCTAQTSKKLILPDRQLSQGHSSSSPSRGSGSWDTCAPHSSPEPETQMKVCVVPR